MARLLRYKEESRAIETVIGQEARKWVGSGHLLRTHYISIALPYFGWAFCFKP